MALILNKVLYLYDYQDIVQHICLIPKIMMKAKVNLQFVILCVMMLYDCCVRSYPQVVIPRKLETVHVVDLGSGRS